MPLDNSFACRLHSPPAHPPRAASPLAARFATAAARCPAGLLTHHLRPALDHQHKLRPGSHGPRAVPHRQNAGAWEGRNPKTGRSTQALLCSVCWGVAFGLLDLGDGCQVCTSPMQALLRPPPRLRRRRCLPATTPPAGRGGHAALPADPGHIRGGVHRLGGLQERGGHH